MELWFFTCMDGILLFYGPTIRDRGWNLLATVREGY